MNLPLVSRLPDEYGPPSISINGPDGAYSVYDLQRQIGPRTRSNGLCQFTDTSPGSTGRHFLKFGADIDHRGVTFRTGACSSRQLRFRRHLHRIGAWPISCSAISDR